MHTWLKLLFAALFVLPAWHAEAEGLRPYLLVDSFSYSEPMSIEAITRDWHGRFDGGTTALTSNRVEIGAAYGNWYLYKLDRLDYQLKMSRDTAEFIYLINNKRPLPNGRTYSIDLTVHHQQSHGFGIGYRYPVADNLTFTASAALLQGTKLTQGSLRGKASVVSKDSYDFDFDVNYFYSRDALFERVNPEPTGQGATLDLGVEWRPRADVQLRLRVADIGGYIDWQQAPFTRAHGSSDVKQFDENGYQVYKPVISGLESNRNYTQSLPTFAEAELTGPLIGDYSGFIDVAHYSSEAEFIRLGVAHPVPWGRMILGTNLTARSAIVGFAGERFQLRLEADRLKEQDIKVLGIRMGLNVPL